MEVDVLFVGHCFFWKGKGRMEVDRVYFFEKQMRCNHANCLIFRDKFLSGFFMEQTWDS